MLKKIPLILFFLIFFWGLKFTEVSFSQEGRIGYIDSIRLRTEFKEFGEAQAKFDKEVSAWEAQADSMKKELDNLQADFDKLKLILSEEKKKEKEDLLEEKELAYQKFTEQVFAPGGRIEKKNAELTKPILDKINQVLEKIALENNYDIIFDSVGGNIAYAKKSIDLTDQVLEELEKLE